MLIIGVLFLRKAIIIGTVVFGPFAMAGLASGKTKSWAVKWVEVVLALALSKFVICAILTLAYSAVGASVTGDITDAFLGSIWVLARRVLPPCRAAVRALRRRPDRCRQHLRRGRRLGQRQTGRSPGQSRGRSRGRRRRRGRRVDRRPSRQQPKRSPEDPGGGGRRPRQSDNAAGITGRKPHHGNGCGSGQPQHGNGAGSVSPSGSTAAAPPASGDPAGLGGGFGTTPSAQRHAVARPGSTGSPGTARDGCLPVRCRAEPVSRGHTGGRGRRTLGCRRPRPTGCSCSTKPGGVLGPQQPGGARRVLAAPTTTGATQ